MELLYMFVVGYVVLFIVCGLQKCIMTIVGKVIQSLKTNDTFIKKWKRLCLVRVVVVGLLKEIKVEILKFILVRYSQTYRCYHFIASELSYRFRNLYLLHSSLNKSVYI